MAKKSTNNNAKRERMNLELPQELAKRLNSYIIKLVTKKGRIPAGIKTKIARAAINEWLQRHENDVDIKLD